MEYYKGYRMKNLKCLMTDIPKISRAFEATVDLYAPELLLSLKDRVRMIQQSMECLELEHFSCTVEGV